MANKMAAPMKSGMRVMRLVSDLSKLRLFRWHYTLRLSSSDSKNTGDDSQVPFTDSEDVLSVEDPGESNTKLTGFARAFAKHATVQQQQQADSHEIAATPEPPKSFATLLRNSSHVHIGNGRGQIVIGKVFHTVEDDLYIDFGGKFHCVCKKPEKDAEKFHRGTKVRLRLRDVELTDHFIGAARDISLLEADADLLGLARPEA